MRILKNNPVSRNETVAVLVERKAPFMVSSDDTKDKFSLATLPVRTEYTKQDSVFHGKHVALLPVYQSRDLNFVVSKWEDMEEIESLIPDTDGDLNRRDNLDQEGKRIVANFHRLMYLFAVCHHFDLELVYTPHDQSGFKMVKTQCQNAYGYAVTPNHTVTMSFTGRGETTKEFVVVTLPNDPDPMGESLMNAPFLGTLEHISKFAMCLPLYTLLDDIVIQKLERKVCVSIGAPLYTFAPEIAPYHEIKNAIAGIGKYVNELIK